MRTVFSAAYLLLAVFLAVTERGQASGGGGLLGAPKDVPPMRADAIGPELGGHFMLALPPHGTGTRQKVIDAQVRRWAQWGFTFMVFHCDAYERGHYRTMMRRYYDACAKAGIRAMASWGWFYWADPGPKHDPLYPARAWIPQIVRDTHDHPAQFRIDGVPVYSAFNCPHYMEELIAPLLAEDGLTIRMWPHMYYLLPESGDKLHCTDRSEVIAHMFDSFPWLSGLANFSGDMTAEQIVQLNRIMTRTAAARGRLSMAGVTPFYGSHALRDMGGFRGLEKQWRGILEDRPNAVWWVTMNDWKELTYIDDLPETPVWRPEWTAHDIATLLDHSGYRKFCEPFQQAYLEGREVRIERDRLFLCHQLHPARTRGEPGSPAHMFGGRVWRTQLPDRIFVAAHLTEPARIRIDDTLSVEFPAGVAHFDVPLRVGKPPRVSLLRAGRVVAEGVGPLPITESPRPGAWNYLAVELELRRDEADREPEMR